MVAGESGGNRVARWLGREIKALKKTPGRSPGVSNCRPLGGKCGFNRSAQILLAAQYIELELRVLS